LVVEGRGSLRRLLRRCFARAKSGVCDGELAQRLNTPAVIG
jgi:hypothetical protein